MQSTNTKGDVASDVVSDVDTDDDLYSKVGKLTRQLHESLNNFMSDSKLETMTNEAMPDARQRLNHVVELTEESAHKTMNMVEHSNPLVRVMGERAGVLLQQLNEHEDSDSSDVNNSKPGFLNEEIAAFMHLVIANSKSVNSDLNEIMLAQNYQDLTGQVINRVSTLVQDVETNLLTLLKLSNEHCDESPVSMVATSVDDTDAKENDNKGFGPAVPGVNQGDVVQSQEEVDDLLSSLGF